MPQWREINLELELNKEGTHIQKISLLGQEHIKKRHL